MAVSAMITAPGLHSSSVSPVRYNPASPYHNDMTQYNNSPTPSSEHNNPMDKTARRRHYTPQWTLNCATDRPPSYRGARFSPPTKPALLINNQNYRADAQGIAPGGSRTTPGCKNGETDIDTPALPWGRRPGTPRGRLCIRHHRRSPSPWRCMGRYRSFSSCGAVGSRVHPAAGPYWRRQDCRCCAARCIR